MSSVEFRFEERNCSLFEVTPEWMLAAYILPICGLGLQYHADYKQKEITYKISFLSKRSNCTGIIFSKGKAASKICK